MTMNLFEAYDACPSIARASLVGVGQSIFFLNTGVLFTLDVIAVGNSQGIIQQCKLTASSSLKDNPACQGRLGQPGAWQPEVNDKNQFLEIDLG